MKEQNCNLASNMTEKGKILIIDDDEGIRASSRVILRHHFDEVVCLTHPEQVKSLDNFSEFDLVMLDMNFRPGATSGKEGLDALRMLLKINPKSHIIMITAYGDIHLAVQAMKEGAVDFIVKPWDNARLLATAKAVFKLSQSRMEVQQLEQKQKSFHQALNHKSDPIIGSSTAMQQLMQLVGKVSHTDASVLVLGENGSGKELIAREIHRRSARSEEAFVAVDLGAVPESLFEAELFGYVQGAFTDARDDKAGRFEMADKGTLFLDEIGNLRPSVQIKLLSVLQNRQIFRLGSNKPIPLDVRLICATNMPLHEMVDSNSFREDLFYRINTVQIRIPPLRERSTDIPELTEYFLNFYARKYNKKLQGIKPNAIKKLSAYNWPGNIRELRHLVERAVIMTEGRQLQAEDFALQDENIEKVPQMLNLEALEKNAIAAAIKKHKGNLSHAARELGLGRTTLYRKMEKYGL